MKKLLITLFIIAFLCPFAQNENTDKKSKTKKVEEIIDENIDEEIDENLEEDKKSKKKKSKKKKRKKGEPHELDFLKGYKYIYMPRIKADNKKLNFYEKLKGVYRLLGLKIVSKKFRFWNKELRENPGLCAYFDFKVGEDKEDDKLYVKIIFSNLHGEELESFTYKSYTDEEKKMEEEILFMIKDDNESFLYEFNENHFTKLDYNELEKISKKAEDIKKYFDKRNISYSKLLEYEGLFSSSSYIPLLGKNIIDEQLAFVKSYLTEDEESLIPDDIELTEDEQEFIEDGYKVQKITVIVLKSVYRVWKPGEVKAELYFIGEDEDENEFYYVGKWNQANKKQIVVRGKFDNNVKRTNIDGNVYKKIK
jgi:hypothetical protein